MSTLTELKGVISRDELLAKVAKSEAASPLEVELGEAVGFTINDEGKATIQHKKGETTLSPTALGNLLTHIGFPKPYLRKIPKEQVSALIMPHLNYWYRDALAGDNLRLLTIEDNAITAIPKANFKHIKVSEVVNAAEWLLGKSIAGYHKVWGTDRSFQFSILTPEQVEIGKKDGQDDLYNAGIRIEHSVSGEMSTSVSPYVFRQWCSNGATTEHQLGSWRRRNGKEDISTWLQRTIIDARKLFNKEVDNLRGLQNIKINSNTSQVLDSVLSQSNVPTSLAKEVRNTMIDDGAENLLDVYNILTKVDTHSSLFEDKPNGKGLLDKVASHLACHSELCPVCHKNMN